MLIVLLAVVAFFVVAGLIGGVLMLWSANGVFSTKRSRAKRTEGIQARADYLLANPEALAAELARQNAIKKRLGS